MRPDLKNSVENRQQYLKTHTAHTSPTSVFIRVITKTKHTKTNPANNSKVTTRGKTTRDTNKGIKGNGTYKKDTNI